VRSWRLNTSYFSTLQQAWRPAATVVAFILGKVLHAPKLFDRQQSWPPAHQTFGIHVQPARRLLGGALCTLLPFAAEQPIEKHFAALGRAFNETENPLPPLT
jgi:hypothetical protein